MKVDSEQALAALRAKLTGEGVGTVVFKRTDGLSVRIENARVDSIGPSAENRGVIGVEFYGSDRVVHVPFVESWEIEYPDYDPYAHDCVYSETPDGFGCARCIYG